MSLDNLVPLSIFAFVASVTPGPINIMLLTSGVNFGIRRSLPLFIGANSGYFFVLLAVGLGLGEIFKTYPGLYNFMKIVSVIYFLHLAWKIVSSSLPHSENEASRSRPLTYFEVVLFQWINPKGLLMAISYFSSYALPESNTLTIVSMAVLFAVINAPSIGIWLLFGSHLKRYLQMPFYLSIFNWTMAILLLASLAPIIFSIHF